MAQSAMAATLACVLLASFTHAAEVEFPYTAWVTGDQVRVRSGPGTDAYPTEELDRHAEVEVYRHDPGGWCAIRPPQGSFSWVPGRFLRPAEEEGIAEITADGVSAWVGSRLQRVREFHWQVKLEQGELVEVLGEKKLINGEGSTAETWCKIAPPAGEFRWISAKYLTRTPPTDVPTTRQTDDLPFNQSAAPPPPSLGDAAASHDSSKAADAPGRWQQREPQTAAARFNPRAANAALRGEPVVPGEHAREPARLGEVAGARPIRIHSEGPTQVSPAGHSVEPRVEPLGGMVQLIQPAVPPSALDSPAEVEAELTQLELDLAQMVVQPPQLWNLEPLRNRAQRVIDANHSPLSRGRARVILENLAQFDAAQQAHRRAERIDLPAQPVSTTYSGAANQTTPLPIAPFDAAVRPAAYNEPAARTEPEPKPIYDAVGILKQAYSRHADAPEYVLTDDSGAILMLLKEAPGRNLHRHLNQRVGLFGRQGFLAKFSKPYLMVERVVELDAATTAQR